MCRLPSVILFFIGLVSVFAQSPHGAELKIDCAQCHKPDGWAINYKTIRFDHNITDFKLEGTHSQTDCKSCHKTLVFNEAPSQCISCHSDIHSMSVGTDCLRCHDSETWLIDEIPELHEKNGFPLIGVHANRSCVECHLSENLLIFEPLGNECINCHKEDYAGTKSPNHAQSGFSTNCIECHSPLGFGWETDIIKHDFFALTMGHDIQDCTQCHTTGNYADASPECISCHQNDYSNTKNPNHSSAGYSTDCASCHSTNPGWTPATINHDFFPLSLGHNIQDCKACHKTDNYADTSPECASCHQNDYANTDNPNHTSAGYSTDCASCHTTNPGWTPATINHDFFPLSLGHNIQDCKACHKTDNYADTSPECVSCHQNDYANTNNPNHTSAGYSTDCASCHSTNPGWTPATINHDFFPLSLGHDIKDCKACHKTGNYADTSADCVTCHQNDYNRATNPNHISAHFPTDCVACHTTNPGWTPATFDHDAKYFPIYSGKHKDEWNNCIQCHPSPSNYAVFTCVSCHKQSETNNDHDEVNNYVYESTACLQCHPDGND